MTVEANAMTDGADSKPMLGQKPLKGHKKYDVNRETRCGIGCFRGDFLQRLATQKSFVLLYGIMGLTLSATYTYYNGTITTIEKRFHIPTQMSGIITIGNDVTTLLIGAIVTYYGGKGHRPRWIGFGMYTVALYCFLNILPHILYGPGDDALSLTQEYVGGRTIGNGTISKFGNKFSDSLCQAPNSTIPEQRHKESSNYAFTILFASQLISGIGGSLYFTLGVSYMDDNAKKSNAPVIASFSFFIRMIGPAIGYTLSSFCLKMYIAPSLTPRINTEDPRWLGAWWMGWVLLGFVVLIIASLLGMFPRELPKAHYRRQMSKKSNNSAHEEPFIPASLHDMLITFRRLSKNKPYVYSNLASLFYFFGYIPYWTYMPKYIEIIYKRTASEASLYTGALGLAFSAIGILSGGFLISKRKPSARSMAVWNATVGLVSAIGLFSYTFLACTATNDPKGIEINGTMSYTQQCNLNCSCDFVKYTPICANGESYISPCHAGCRDFYKNKNGTIVFSDCSCVRDKMPTGSVEPAIASVGPCPADCDKYFLAFLVLLCFLKFIGATARTSNFLIAIRCVDEKDKPASMGLSSTFLSLFAFIPSPIFFGYLIDTTCSVWGRTESGKGNCWLYDSSSLKYVLNSTASSLVLISVIFDIATWYYVKDVAIFDVEEEKFVGMEKTANVANGDAEKTGANDETSEEKADEKI